MDSSRAKYNVGAFLRLGVPKSQDDISKFVAYIVTQPPATITNIFAHLIDHINSREDLQLIDRIVPRIHGAIYYKYSIVTYIIKYKWNSALFREIVERAVRAGADINLPDRKDRTPLVYLLSRRVDIEDVRWLMSLGASPNIRSGCLVTAIRYYVSGRDVIPMLKLMAEYGFNPDNHLAKIIIDELSEKISNRRQLFDLIIGWQVDLSKAHYLIGLAFINGEFDLEFLRFMLDMGVPVMRGKSIDASVYMVSITPNKIQALQMILDAAMKSM